MLADRRPNMLVVLVGIVIFLAVRIEAGHNYHAPSSSLNVPHAYPTPYSYSYNNPQPLARVQNAYQYASNPVQQNSHQYATSPVQQNAYHYASNPVQQNSHQYATSPVQQNAYHYASNPVQQNSHQYATSPVQQNTYQYATNPAQQNAYQYASNPVQQNSHQYAASPVQQNTYQYATNPAQQNAYQYASNPVQQNSYQYSVSPSNYNYLNHQNPGSYQIQTGFTPITTPQHIPHREEAYSTPNSGLYNNGPGSSGNVITTHDVSQQTSEISVSQSYNSNYVSQGTSVAAPVVTKHIYFHVPPAEIEERPVTSVPSTPPKKVYNIVFIKVPSSAGSINGARVLGSALRQQALVQDKTLIYVLVKKPDPQVLQQPSLNSQHEVFYVKYKGDVNEVANRINRQLPQQGAAAVLQSDVQSVVEPVLQAATVNTSR